jgi:hypothetical protein
MNVAAQTAINVHQRPIERVSAERGVDRVGGIAASVGIDIRLTKRPLEGVSMASSYQSTPSTM